MPWRLLPRQGKYPSSKSLINSREKFQRKWKTRMSGRDRPGYRSRGMPTATPSADIPGTVSIIEGLSKNGRTNPRGPACPCANRRLETQSM